MEKNNNNEFESLSWENVELLVKSIARSSNRFRYFKR